MEAERWRYSTEEQLRNGRTIVQVRTVSCQSRGAFRPKKKKMRLHPPAFKESLNTTLPPNIKKKKKRRRGKKGNERRNQQNLRVSTIVPKGM